MTSQQFNDDLWRFVEDAAQQLNLGIGSDCRGDLQQMIAAAISRVRNEGRTLTNGLLLDVAHNLLLMVGAMAHEARKRNLSELRETTLFEAKSSLCPLWPFC